MAKRNLISRSGLAVKAKVSRQAVTKACKGCLKPAIVDKKLDLDHAAVIAYLKKPATSKTVKKAATTKGKKKAALKKPPTNKKPTTTTRTDKQAANAEEVARIQSYFEGDIDVEPLLDLPLRELVAKFGTGAQFKDYTVACKNLEDIRTRKIKNQKAEGLLIPRKLVSDTIFSAIENSNMRLLQDTPLTITARVMALVKAGGTVEECETLVRGLISTQLKGITAAAQRTLKPAKDD